MHRCAFQAPPSLLVPLTKTAYALLVSTAVLFSATSHAQQPRKFPPEALRGTLKVVVAPDIFLDGKADRLSPGARIRNPRNSFVRPSGLVNQELVVNYTRGHGGLVHEVWLLTPEEAAIKRPKPQESK